ncbi:hypothetical protein [Tsukamurella soli]|uniref:Uncharacterized protein n=1 Tax=Tsukamurella soli TaxID=644556 RepID=A0ABP8K7J7_9ACTN
MTACFYVLDVPENRGVIDVAEGTGVSIDRVGPYFRISGGSEIVVDRRASGARHAVWYSVIAGLEGSTIAQHDKNALRVVAV